MNEIRRAYLNRHRARIVLTLLALIPLFFLVDVTVGLGLGTLAGGVAFVLAYELARPVVRNRWLEVAWTGLVYLLSLGMLLAISAAFALSFVEWSPPQIWFDPDLGFEAFLLLAAVWSAPVGYALASIHVIRRRGQPREMRPLRYLVGVLPLAIVLFFGAPEFLVLVPIVLGGFAAWFMGFGLFRTLRPVARPQPTPEAKPSGDPTFTPFHG